MTSTTPLFLYFMINSKSITNYSTTFIILCIVATFPATSVAV